MSVLYVAGFAANLANGATFASSSVDTDFPVANAQNGRPYEPMRFNTAASGDWLRADLGSAVAVSFVSLHNQNIDDVTSISVQSDTSSGFGSPTARGTLPIKNPGSYLSFTASPNERYHRLLFNGTNGSPLFLGEYVIAAHSTLTRNQNFGWSVSRSMPQTRTVARNGAELITNMSANGIAPRTLTMEWTEGSATDRDEVIAMLEACAWGNEPLVIVPDDNQNIVIHGRVAQTWGFSYTPGLNAAYTYGLTVVEDPGPVVTK